MKNIIEYAVDKYNNKKGHVEKMYLVEHKYREANTDDYYYADVFREPVCLFKTKEEAERFVKDYEKPTSTGLKMSYGLITYGDLEIREVGFEKPLGDFRKTFWWLFGYRDEDIYDYQDNYDYEDDYEDE